MVSVGEKSPPKEPSPDIELRHQWSSIHFVGNPEGLAAIRLGWRTPDNRPNPPTAGWCMRTMQTYRGFFSNRLSCRRRVEVLDRSNLGNTGAVDQHVETTQTLDRRAHDGLTVRRRGNVARRRGESLQLPLISALVANIRDRVLSLSIDPTRAIRPYLPG